MNERHTPAPWSYYQCADEGYGIQGEDYMGDICNISSPRNARQARIARNNARLICLAPKLLEACEALVTDPLADKRALPILSAISKIVFDYEIGV